MPSVLRAGLLVLAVVMTSSACDIVQSLVGAPVPTPMPTSATEPPVTEAKAIETATPVAETLSAATPRLVSAAAYDAAVYCDPADFCPGVSGPVWAVTFDVLDPGGEWSPAVIVIDGTTGQFLYSGQ